MIGYILYSLLLFVFFLIIFLRIYNNFIYPLLQLFKKKNEHGYILINISEFEHRHIVQKLIGRTLTVKEEVHHINGKKWDNRKSNLALMSRENHQEWHEFLVLMYQAKKFPSIKQQKNKLEKDFAAILFR